MTENEFIRLFNFDQLEGASPGTPLRVGIGGTSATVVWCPGNGSRHVVIFTAFPPVVGETVGCPSGGILVTLAHHWRSYPIDGLVLKRGGMWHTENYVAEKFPHLFEDCLVAAKKCEGKVPVEDVFNCVGDVFTSLRGETIWALSAIVNSSLNCMCEAYAEHCIEKVQSYG